MRLFKVAASLLMVTLGILSIDRTCFASDSLSYASIVVCPGRQPELADLYEFSPRKELDLPTTQEQALEELLGRLAKTDPERASRYRKRIQEITSTPYLTKLEKRFEKESLLTEADCEIHTFAGIKPRSLPGDLLLSIEESEWTKLNQPIQALVLFHLVVAEEFLSLESNSMRSVRHFVSQIAHSKTPWKTQGDYFANWQLYKLKKFAQFSVNGASLHMDPETLKFYANGKIQSGVVAGSDSKVTVQGSLHPLYAESEILFFENGKLKQGEFTDEFDLAFSEYNFTLDKFKPVILYDNERPHSVWVKKGFRAQSGSCSLPIPPGLIDFYPSGILQKFDMASNREDVIEFCLHDPSGNEYKVGFSTGANTDVASSAEFYSNGQLKAGFLVEETRLPVATKQVRFSRNSLVEFYESSFVKSGELAEDNAVELVSYLNGTETTKTYSGYATLDFDAQGRVLSIRDKGAHAPLEVK